MVHYTSLSGSGIVSSIKGLVSNVKNRFIAPRGENEEGFPGEHHAILKLQDGRIRKGNLIGPGTNIIARIKRGDRGITPVDKISEMHDINYSLANNLDDIRAADDRMLRDVKQVKDRHLDSRINIAQANAIKLKKYGQSMPSQAWTRTIQFPKLISA